MVLLAAAATLAALPPETSDRVIARLRQTALVPFLSSHDAVRRHLGLTRRLRDLRGERDSLARELVQLRGVREENREMRELLELPDGSPTSLVAAEIEPGRVRHGEARTFTVTLSGREPPPVPAAVLTARGLVGVLRSVTGDTGVGHFWTHPDFRVSVRTDTGRTTGIVRAARRDGHTTMVFEGAPYQTEVPGGTRLVTSGLGGIYPPGVPVGRVRELSGVESGWERSYRVEPAVRPGEVDVVLIRLRADGGP